MTNESPKGLKFNLMRSYTSDPISNPEFFEDCRQVEAWRQLLFGLVFFHAVVQERRSFGSLGWNIPYEFNETDLRISVTQLKLFLNEYDTVPLQALSYLTGECNYGGRVTDDKDRRLLNSILSKFYCEEILQKQEYKFSSCEAYKLPLELDQKNCVDYFQGLPLVTDPEVFGLNENADITKDTNLTSEILAGVLKTQPLVFTRQASADGATGVTQIAKDILSRLPSPFPLEEVEKKFPITYSNSMHTVLKQELIRFNRLLDVIKWSLTAIGRAVVGEVVMSPDLELLHDSLLLGQVPAVWKSKSYPSLKPLGGFISDLLLRLAFFQTWIDHGAPKVYWLPGFFFTQSFLTAVLQNFSRSRKEAIDNIGFQFYVTDFEGEVRATGDPPYGVYTTGLFLEGARWDRQTRCLDESLPKILYDHIPIIWFKPGLKEKFVREKCYQCPVYKTSIRRGVLSTTGHSTNFVMSLDLPTIQPEQHWINRGVACLSQLDD